MRISVTNNNLAVTALPGATRILRTAQTLRVVVQGGRGPKGEPGNGSSRYVHDQMTPAITWTITHGLNCHPSVSVVDSADTVVYGDITYLSPNQVQIGFSAAFAGKAYLN